ncbi:hypothetical protein D770_03230 [Flammeovirgaceae bacterium 311]|nr:hypothetical protein D770_03230 [Flammeovirgaceae bacterium 311]
MKTLFLANIILIQMNKNKILATPFLALMLLVLALSGCEKVEDRVKFSFHDSANITIPSQSIISAGFLKIPSPEVQTSSQQAFENNNTQAKYVKEAKLTALSLSITSPQSQSFSFLNEIKLYISAPGQEEVLLASKINIPNSVGQELPLDVTNVNLKPYIQGDSYTIRSEVKVDEVTTQEIKIRADMHFSVTADVF